MEGGLDSSMVHDSVLPRSTPVENPIVSNDSSSEATDSMAGSMTASTTDSDERGEGETHEEVDPTADRRPREIPGTNSFNRDQKCGQELIIRPHLTLWRC